MNFEKLTEYLDSLEEKYGIPANDCKVTKEHEVIYRKVTGHADYKKKVPLTASHMFRLFSATKLFIPELAVVDGVIKQPQSPISLSSLWNIA